MVRSQDKIKRRGAPKVKSGCKTCKTRRIKCDEMRPGCANCTSTGRVCDGYPPSIQFCAVIIQSTSNTAGSSSPTLMPVARMRKRSQRYQSSDSDIESSVELGMPLQQPKVFPGSSQEQYFFTLFRQYHAPILGGYFDSDFWNVQLPRVAHSEPAVYHAILAISTLDQDGMPDAEALYSKHNMHFLLHYNKAIYFVKFQLQKDKTSQYIILLTCLLFICLEFKRGNTEVALDHLQNGLGILHAQESDPESSELLDSSKSLTHAFSRLSIQSSLVGRQPPPGYHQALETSHSEHVPFSNIEEARNSLVYLFIESLKPIGAEFNFEASFTTSFSEQSRRANLISQLRHWSSQLGLFVTDILISPTPQDLRMIRLLRIQSLVAIIWNSTTIPSSDGSSIEPAFDSYTKMFQTIISLTGLFIDDPPTQISTPYSTSSSEYSPCSTNSSITTPLVATSRSLITFSLETGLIFALYFVAIKCRSPTIRRQAAYFLSRVEPQREGMWDARVLGNISRYVIEFEESGCFESVTEDVRTWPGEKCRVHAIYILPRCDYQGRVQRATFFWEPAGREGGLVEWTEDIRF